MATLSDPRQEEYLQWLTTAPELREITSASAFAEHLGVSRRTLYDWRNKSEFRDEWEARAIKIAGDPERTQRILDALFEVGTDVERTNMVPAARAWADIAGVIKPPKKDADKIDTDNLSKAEVDALLLELLAAKEAAGQ